MINTEKIQNILNQNSNKIKLLKEERNKLLYDSIKQIDDTYEKKINELINERNKIIDVGYLDLNDSIDAIVYLVNKIEKDIYQKVTIQIRYKGIQLQDNVETTIMADYLVIGLTNDEKNVELNEYSTYKEENLNIPFYNFIKLAHFNVKNKDNIKVNYLNDTYSKYSNDTSIIDSFISDYRFSYIKEYILKVIDYKLNKDNFEITLDEMLRLADSFVDEYKDHKKLVKDIN